MPNKPEEARLHQANGGLVCEAYYKSSNQCLLPAKDYIRTKVERKGWPDPTMPIALCAEHAGKRVALSDGEVGAIMDKIFK
jgi:hypothetical protein